MNFTHYLFDIEGTVAPISFVHEVLFPYAKEKLPAFIQKNAISKTAWESIFLENQKDISEKKYSLALKEPTDKDSLVEYLQFLISVDRKNSGLKEIQGFIWEEGYKLGEIQSTIFSDAVEYFEFLYKNHKTIAIYSSGSILAQKLIFRYSTSGDLTQYISAYFDTTSGPKKESASYKNILQSLNILPEQLIFYTDIVEEAKASNIVKVTSVILVRPGNQPQNLEGFSSISHFTTKV